jgi:hypothetical protein
MKKIIAMFAMIMFVAATMSAQALTAAQITALVNQGNTASANAMTNYNKKAGVKKMSLHTLKHANGVHLYKREGSTLVFVYDSEAGFFIPTSDRFHALRVHTKRFMPKDGTELGRKMRKARSARARMRSEEGLDADVIETVVEEDKTGLSGDDLKIEPVGN